MIEKKRAPAAASQPQEYVPAPELEYADLRSVPEFQPPPPEFGQKTVPEPEPEKKRRLSLRSLLAIPAIGLLGFFGFRMLKPAQPQEPEPPPSVTEPAETLPVETAEPIPVLPTGSVILDVDYAVRDGDLVLYKYDVYTPEPSLDATQAQIDAYNGPIWPVSVFAQVSDSANNAVYPETDPDVWEDFRYSDEEYVINAAGLEGELKLTLRAEYVERGETRQTVVERDLSQIPPTPETRAELTALGGNRVEFTAWLKPQSGDGSDFDLEVAYMDQCAYSEGEKMYFSLVDDPAAVPVEYDPENGFTVRYTGGSALQSIPADAELSLAVSLRDRNTGYLYTIESNRIQAPDEAELSADLRLFLGGWAEFNAAFKIPEGDDHDYDLAVEELTLRVLGEEEYPMVSEPGELEITGSNEEGYLVRYYGQAAASLKGNASCTAYIRMIDNSTGQTYEAETVPVQVAEAANELPVFPLSSGKVSIVVYNDTMSFQVPTPVGNENEYTILDVNTFPMEEFFEYELPEPIAPSGYTFLGWVVHVGNPFDLNSEWNPFAFYDGDPPVDVLTSSGTYAFPVERTLTRADVEHIPPDAEGVRNVNVHAVWTRQDPAEELLFLGDGQGNLTAYDMDVPLASEGYLYLCRYPVPEREGWTFTGWYDSEGNRVDLLVCYFSFVPMLYNEDGDFIGYDWNTYTPVYLTAGWKLDTENSP